MTDEIRIGAVSYLNALPLVHGIEAGLGSDRIRLSYAAPSVLADQMERGELDVALLPVIELARHPNNELVPGLGIVTRGPSRSVLLLHRRPLAKATSVALDRDSRTSNALTRVLFATVWKASPRFEIGSPDLEEALESHDAVLRIGDKALFDPVPKGVSVTDLGGVWTESTGRPFVFAAWIARPGVVDRELYRTLHESRRRGSRAIDEIARAFRYRGGAYPDAARDYLTHNILFRLGGAELDAMETFYRAAAGLGLIEAVPQIRRVFERRTECHERAEQAARP